MVPHPSLAPISVDMPVAEVMSRWPQTVSVFLGRGMACPGCPMAPFMTIADAASSYSIGVEELVEDLGAVIPVDEPGARP